MRGVLCRVLLMLPAAALGPCDAGQASVADGVREWRFEVSLDGKRIGEHSFVRTVKDGQVQVDIRARFQIRFLSVPVYRYEHENREVWRDGCLQRIDARTRDNGEQLFVRGQLGGDAFTVQTSRGGERLSGCINTFAYWDRKSLSAGRLLNAQTGEYVPVNVTSTGREPVRAGGRERVAERLKLRAPDLAIDLWYSPEGEWMALESKTKDGRTLRYEIPG